MIWESYWRRASASGFLREVQDPAFTKQDLPGEYGDVAGLQVDKEGPSGTIVCLFWRLLKLFRLGYSRHRKSARSESLVKHRQALPAFFWISLRPPGYEQSRIPLIITRLPYTLVIPTRIPERWCHYVSGGIFIVSARVGGGRKYEAVNP